MPRISIHRTFCFACYLAAACAAAACLSVNSAWAQIATADGAAATDDEVALFNGKDLSGWTHVLSDSDVKMEDVWSVEGGVLKCKGRPAGYLRTEKDDYQNYRLTLEWRWPRRGGNNGVLVHTSTPDELGVWPKSLEVQLASRNAGDFWVIGTQIDTPNEPKNPKTRRHLNLTDKSEKKLGEWNEMEICCFEDVVVVRVNGELVNHGQGSTVTSGAICLQSEGTPIEYRNILLSPLEEKPSIDDAQPDAGAESPTRRGRKPAGSGKKGSGTR